MPRIFIGHIPKNSTTKHLVNMLYSLKKIKSVKIVFPLAPKMTKGFAIFDIKFKKGMNIEKLKDLGIKFKGEKLYFSEYLEGDDIKQRDLELSRKKIYVSGIPAGVTKFQLNKFFSIFGAVETAYICHEKAYNQFQYGFVTFYEEDDARRCKEIQEFKYKGAILKVKKFTPKGAKILQRAGSRDNNSEYLSSSRKRKRREFDNYEERNHEYNQSRHFRNRKDLRNRKSKEVENIRYHVPMIDFSVRDGLWEVIETSYRIDSTPSNLRFNQVNPEEYNKKIKKLEEYKKNLLPQLEEINTPSSFVEDFGNWNQESYEYKSNWMKSENQNYDTRKNFFTGYLNNRDFYEENHDF